MGLWSFLGGKRIGPGHPRYEEKLKKQQEDEERGEELVLKQVCHFIMDYGMPDALKLMGNLEKNLNRAIVVLKRYPNCPLFTDPNDKYHEELEDHQIYFWKQAQKWLKKKELEEQNLEQNDEQQSDTEYIEKLEARMKKLEEKLNQYEKE